MNEELIDGLLLIACSDALALANFEIASLKREVWEGREQYKMIAQSRWRTEDKLVEAEKRIAELERQKEADGWKFVQFDWMDADQANQAFAETKKRIAELDAAYDKGWNDGCESYLED